jgi:DNA-binding SARP family transcriptional activator
MTPVIAVQLLGGFQLHVNDEHIPVPPSSQRLLAHLAVQEAPLARTAIASALWPGTTPRRAAACLRSALWRLVRPPNVLVNANQGMLGIASDVQVDLAAVRRFAAELAGAARTRLTPSVPLTLLTSDLLPGWTDTWLVAEREWFRQLCLRVLEMLSERFRADGDHFHAHETAVAAVRGDPLRESAHRRLIELHLADGNPAAALRQYASYRTRLRDELGLSPSPEIQKLLPPVLAAHE